MANIPTPTACEEIFLEEIFVHILDISRGDCNISDEMVENVESPAMQNILSGLQMLHEDLNLYKAELKASMEAEYQLNVLKERNKELAQFNYVASHDLQEPLKTIQNFSSLLEKQYRKDLDDKANLYLQYILQASKRMSSLILDLLNYSRIGKIQEFTKVDLSLIIAEVLVDLKASIEETNTSFQIKSLPIIWGNRQTIRQVFQNLISNAIKFQPVDAHPKIEISSIPEKDGYIIKIKDNGIGIQQAHQEKIFTIFQRLHSKEKYEGTGIGLAICKKIIEMHNGRIWLESTPGQGSCFCFFLPAAK